MIGFAVTCYHVRIILTLNQFSTGIDIRTWGGMYIIYDLYERRLSCGISEKLLTELKLIEIVVRC